MIHYLAIAALGQPCYVISSHQMWLPGSYATKQAANYAFRFTDEQLTELRNRINGKEERPITFEDLQQYRKQLNQQP